MGRAPLGPVPVVPSLCCPQAAVGPQALGAAAFLGCGRAPASRLSCYPLLCFYSQLLESRKFQRSLWEGTWGAGSSTVSSWGHLVAFSAACPCNPAQPASWTQGPRRGWGIHISARPRGVWSRESLVGGTKGCWGLQHSKNLARPPTLPHAPTLGLEPSTHFPCLWSAVPPKPP